MFIIPFFLRQVSHLGTNLFRIYLYNMQCVSRRCARSPWVLERVFMMMVMWDRGKVALIYLGAESKEKLTSLGTSNFCFPIAVRICELCLNLRVPMSI